MDLAQREWQVLNKLVEDGSLASVSAIALRSEFKPIWEDNVLNWVKETNARAILHLDTMSDMEQRGMKIWQAHRDLASPDNSEWMITWLRAEAKARHALSM